MNNCFSNYRRNNVDPPIALIKEVVSKALAEDLMPLGDLTSSLFPDNLSGRAKIVAKSTGVLAGRLCAQESFYQFDPRITVDWQVKDGDSVTKDVTVAALSGPLVSILTAERTALNFLCHLSGIATLTRRFVEQINDVNPNCQIWDTRKTTPGLRTVEKAAVRAGGGFNHRGNLSESILIKDNHVAKLSIADAVALARKYWPGKTVQVECDTLEQVEQALYAKASIIMLDNMDLSAVKSCVELINDKRNSQSQQVLIEVSGGVNLDTVGLYAAAGVDVISVGAITHSAPILDLGLDIE
ncbi:MAG: carboxylating nicotinate-nucleotide diphosphorylase [Actinobacteria bacterium]|nr:carboxylating nicotinate-nucleotide diphosphorylase [Actinomycetota bacterium]MCL6104931.1 carboxylating nicotinate-nucleotide diphosphorylase [Actinomycetota bacterium]